MTKAIRLTRSGCKPGFKLHWEIEASHKVVFHIAPNDVDGEGHWAPNGRHSPGTCINCQESRMFKNSVPTSTQLT